MGAIKEMVWYVVRVMSLLWAVVVTGGILWWMGWLLIRTGRAVWRGDWETAGPAVLFPVLILTALAFGVAIEWWIEILDRRTKDKEEAK